MEVELKNLGTINQNEVVLTNSEGKKLHLYFSYATIVGVNNFTAINEWSNTTGKLLNKLNPRKKERIPHSELLKIVETELAKIIK